MSQPFYKKKAGVKKKKDKEMDTGEFWGKGGMERVPGA